MSSRAQHGDNTWFIFVPIHKIEDISFAVVCPFVCKYIQNFVDATPKDFAKTPPTPFGGVVSVFH